MVFCFLLERKVKTRTKNEKNFEHFLIGMNTNILSRILF